MADLRYWPEDQHECCRCIYPPCCSTGRSRVCLIRCLTSCARAGCSSSAVLLLMKAQKAEWQELEEEAEDFVRLSQAVSVTILADP